MVNTSKRNKTFLIIMAVSLVVGIPLSFDIIARVLGKDKLSMPVYYKADEKIPSRQAMKLVHEGTLKPVTDLQAVNQFGDQVSLNHDLRDKMLVVNVFFTTCTASCPKLTQHIKLLEYAFRRTPKSRNDTTVQFISISVDPANDSVRALRNYAKHWAVDENHWWFLTGDKRALYDWARTQLHLSVPAGDGGADDFIHSNQLVLLDRDRYIRAITMGLIRQR